MSIFFGIDIGGTSVKTALVSVHGDILDKGSFPTEAENGFDDLCRRARQALEQSIQRTGVDGADVRGVGVGVPAFIDVERGVVLEAVNLGWYNIPLVRLLEETFGLPVAFDNDANLAALGESWTGAGQGQSSVLCTTIGTGVGAGIVIDGRLVRGAGGMAGEIGHMVIQKGTGIPCNCGQNGCLETLASATAIVRMAKQHPALQGAAIDGAEDVFTLARSGNQDAAKVVAEAGEWLGYGLSLTALTLNPAVIVIGGGVSKAKDMLLQPVLSAFHKYSLPLVSKSTSIVLASLGNDAGVVGAARLVAQAVEATDA